ncbi:zinc finger, C2H2-type domain containing protein [Pseudohyphozyma bogoriensis]|nr:zinc finger, C2H2-type domain containing protein [Pseudohyphozyma bogoriensis]
MAGLSSDARAFDPFPLPSFPLDESTPLASGADAQDSLFGSSLLTPPDSHPLPQGEHALSFLSGGAPVTSGISHLPQPDSRRLSIPTPPLPSLSLEPQPHLGFNNRRRLNNAFGGGTDPTGGSVANHSGAGADARPFLVTGRSFSGQGQFWNRNASAVPLTLPGATEDRDAGARLLFLGQSPREVEGEEDTLAAVRGLLGIAGESGGSNGSDVDAEGMPDDDFFFEEDDEDDHHARRQAKPQQGQAQQQQGQQSQDNWTADQNSPSSTAAPPSNNARSSTRPARKASAALPGLIAASAQSFPSGNELSEDDAEGDDEEHSASSGDDDDGDDEYSDQKPKAKRANLPATTTNAAAAPRTTTLKRPRSDSSSSPAVPAPAPPAPAAANPNGVRARTTALPNKRRYRASTTSGTGNFRCLYPFPDGTVCPVSFRRSYDLARHKESKHGKVENGMGKREWVCKGCGGEFARKDSLQRHAVNKGHIAGL